jgi:hypothetical protein
VSKQYRIKDDPAAPRRRSPLGANNGASECDAFLKNHSFSIGRSRQTLAFSPETVASPLDVELTPSNGGWWHRTTVASAACPTLLLCVRRAAASGPLNRYLYCLVAVHHRCF